MESTDKDEKRDKRLEKLMNDWDMQMKNSRKDRVNGGIRMSPSVRKAEIARMMTFLERRRKWKSDFSGRTHDKDHNNNDTEHGEGGEQNSPLDMAAFLDSQPPMGGGDTEDESPGSGDVGHAEDQERWNEEYLKEMINTIMRNEDQRQEEKKEWREEHRKMKREVEELKSEVARGIEERKKNDEANWRSRGQNRRAERKI